MRRPLSILIAEDNPADVELIRESLKEVGLSCDLILAENGEVAANLISEVGSQLPCPDLVILDWSLQRLDGEAVLKKLRSNPICADLPVLVATSLQSPEALRVIESYGAAYFCKPNDWTEFLKVADVIKGLTKIS